MEIFSALLALCAGNSTVTGEFSTQRPVTRSFDLFFDLHRTKRLSKQSWGWWFETPSSSSWRHCNEHGIDRRLVIHMVGYVNIYGWDADFVCQLFFKKVRGPWETSSVCNENNLSIYRLCNVCSNWPSSTYDMTVSWDCKRYFLCSSCHPA